MSIALQSKIKELEQRVLVLEAQTPQQQKEDLEDRVKALENKYTMLNARVARGKTD